MITKELEVSLRAALSEVIQQKSGSITVDLVLRTLLNSLSNADVLSVCEANIDEIKRLLTISSIYKYMHQNGISSEDLLNFISSNINKAQDLIVSEKPTTPKPKTFPEAFIAAGGTSEQLHLLISNRVMMGQVVELVKTMNIS